MKCQVLEWLTLLPMTRAQCGEMQLTTCEFCVINDAAQAKFAGN
jgi:hypothetical protein